jgi:hypothetical protein
VSGVVDGNRGYDELDRFCPSSRPTFWVAFRPKMDPDDLLAQPVPEGPVHGRVPAQVMAPRRSAPRPSNLGIQPFGGARLEHLQECVTGCGRVKPGNQLRVGGGWQAFGDGEGQPLARSDPP